LKNHFIISAPGFEPLHITSEIPAGLQDHFIPGSKIFAAEASFGKFFIQLIELNGFSWLYSVFTIKKDVTLFAAYPENLLASHIALRGNFEHTVKGIGHVSLRESQFNIFFLPALNCTMFFKKNENYISLDICYPAGFMLRILPLFPLFDEFAKNISRLKASAMPGGGGFMNAVMAQQVYQLIHSPFSPAVKNFHLKITRNLLTAMLTEATLMHPKEHKFFIHHVELVYAAKEFIDSNLSRHFSTEDISKKVGLNEKALKRGFKEIFGRGMFEYLLMQRLHIARIQVEQTDKSFKMIARQAGYKNVTNFSTAFKKMFGDTPLMLRIKAGNK
jgi:AraC-like DNA-binding protein